MPVPSNIEDFYLHFGLAVKYARELMDLNQAEVANLIGKSRESIANIEAGRQRVMLHDAVGLSKVLNIDIFNPKNAQKLTEKIVAEKQRELKNKAALLKKIKDLL